MDIKRGCSIWKFENLIGSAIVKHAPTSVEDFIQMTKIYNFYVHIYIDNHGNNNNKPLFYHDLF